MIIDDDPLVRAHVASSLRAMGHAVLEPQDLLVGPRRAVKAVVDLRGGDREQEDRLLRLLSPAMAVLCASGQLLPFVF